MEYIFLTLLLALVIYVVFRERRAEKELAKFKEEVPLLIEGIVAKTFQNSASTFESIFSSAISKNTDVIKGAFATSLKELGIQEDLGRLKEASNDLKNITSDLKSMFQIKHARARFGELQLEVLLRDIFPSNRLSFQKDIGSCRPDACILIESGRYLCIDSKFPLENFKKYCETDQSKDKFWKEFVRDVKKHIEDIRNKYVGKDNTADFAFMFVPSDAVFYQLISRSPEVVVEASKSRVILTSPSTLPAYLNLVLAKIRAEEISVRAEEIQRKIDIMGEYIKELEDKLETLFRHINHAYNSTSRVQQALLDLKRHYSRILERENFTH